MTASHANYMLSVLAELELERRAASAPAPTIPVRLNGFPSLTALSRASRRRVRPITKAGRTNRLAQAIPISSVFS